MTDSSALPTVVHSDFVLPVGVSAAVAVPASSANLGPGFDTLGIALSMFDELAAVVTESGLTIEVTGEGAGEVPGDETHLVIAAMHRAFAALGVRAPGLHVVCANAIPHSRGLGSSAAAVVGGIALADALAAQTDSPRGLDLDVMIQLSSEFEGHPDNAAASVVGGAVVAWTESPDPRGAVRYGAHRLNVSDEIIPYAFVPAERSSTAHTRGLLPEEVPHRDAAFNASRAALMVTALTERPDLLLTASEDRLHQGYRAAAMPATATLVRQLRDAQVAAMVSGAGPSVLALATEELSAELTGTAESAGFVVHRLEVADGVRRA